MINPYAGIDWGTTHQIKSCSHDHTNTQARFDALMGLGVEHHMCTHYKPSRPFYPPQDFFTDIPPGLLASPGSEKTNATDYTGHWVACGSTLAGYGIEDGAKRTDWRSLFNLILDNLQYEDGGGVIIAHPANQNLKNNCAMLDHDPRVLGFEVYNHGYHPQAGYAPGWSYQNLYPMWDRILTTGRRCWGFAVIDWLTAGQEPFCGFSMLLCPERTERACLRAYRNGAFYAMVQDTGLRFTRIHADQSTFSVALNREAKITILTERGAVKTVTGTSAEYHVPPGTIFVRAETQEGDPQSDGLYKRMFTQPVMYQALEEMARKKAVAQAAIL